MDCDKCKKPSERWFRFAPCRHTICANCIADIVWDANNTHHICCFDPTCLICDSPADIIAETDTGTSKMLYEIRL